MDGKTPFLNSEVWNLDQRHAMRKKYPKMRQARALGLFDVNVYLADKRNRERATLARQYEKNITAGFERAAELHKLPTRERMGKAKLRKATWLTSARKAGDSAFNEGAPAEAPAEAPASDGNGVMLRWKIALDNAETEAKHILTTRRHRAAQQEVFADAASVASKTKRGFNKPFVELVVGMSFLPLAKLSHIAANDFLRYPMMMVACYLEWATGCTALANSGQLSTAASMAVTQLGDTLVLASAGCLDYFDAAYTKIDTDGEYAGFTISGHVLRNQSMLDYTDPEFAQLPLIMTKPLAVIQVALKHDIKDFLAQPVVNRVMRTVWVGGGTNELNYGEPWIRYKVNIWLAFGWVFYLPYNLVVMLISSVFPPFSKWYFKRFQLHKLQTHDRLVWGLTFVPCIKYSLSYIGHVVIAYLFTSRKMMPYYRDDGLDDSVPLFRGDAPWTTTDVYMWIHVIGALVDELSNLYHVMFDGLEIGAQWASVLALFAEAAAETVHELGHELHLQDHVSSQPSCAPKAPQPSSNSRPKPEAEGKKHTLSAMAAELAHAVSMTLQALIAPSRLQKYLANDSLELLTRVLCLVSLWLAADYSQKDYEAVHVNMFHKESILSFTVLLLWIRLVQVMKIFSSTGALVYMLNMMLRDVIRWLLIYMFGLVAFSAGMYILYRNRRAAIGSPHWRLGVHDECGNLGPMLGDSVVQAALYLSQATLEGSDSWECFYQSSAQTPAMIMLISFLIAVVIMLLNTLIAMMAETFTKVSTFAFRNYASSFGHVLVTNRCKTGTVVPTNLLSIPYKVSVGLLALAWNVCSALSSKSSEDNPTGSAAAVRIAPTTR